MNCGGAYTINIIFTAIVNKEKGRKRVEGKAHIQIGYSINPTCNFPFESKSCIIGMNLSAFREGEGISNLKK